MKIELVPIIELGYCNQGLEQPKVYPVWDYPDIWYEYHQASFKKAGFKDELVPYLKWSALYEPHLITDPNLIKIVQDHTEDFRNGKYEREMVSCLFGGYILRIDGIDEYFPQCCGDLGDIHYWKKLSEGKLSYYEGHPDPILTFSDGRLEMDFSVKEHDETFDPAPRHLKLILELNALKSAVQNAEIVLHEFGKRLIEINMKANIGIDRLDDLLIWENPNHEYLE